MLHRFPHVAFKARHGEPAKRHGNHEGGYKEQESRGMIALPCVHGQRPLQGCTSGRFPGQKVVDQALESSL